MPRHASIGRAAAAAIAFTRHRVVHTHAGGNTFRISGDEENLARAEVALGVLFGTLHGEWQSTSCAGIRIERDPGAIAVAPRVLLFSVDRVAGLSDAAVARFGRCAAWYHRKENDERSTLFARFPEPPIDGPEVDEILRVLSAGISDGGRAVMSIVGRTPRMLYGFHTAATYEQAYASFKDDGYEIVTSPAEATWAHVEWPSLVRVP